MITMKGRDHAKTLNGISSQRRRNMTRWVEGVNLAESDLCESPTFDQEFGKRLIKKCSFFLDQMEEWQNIVIKGDKVYAWQRQSGLGDRLAGLISAFNYAFMSKSRLFLIWDHLDAVFDPSCFVLSKWSLLNMFQGGGKRDIFSILGREEKFPNFTANKNCTFGACVAARRLEKFQCEHEGISVNENIVYLSDRKDRVRGCSSTRNCRRQQKFYGRPLTTVEILGCPLRLLLTPKHSFLNTKVGWSMGGQIHRGKLTQLYSLVSGYKTVALHLRLGDWQMSQGNSNKPIKFFEKIRESATRCLKLVSSSIGSEDEVKWIIASDSQQVRDYYRNTFPERTISILNPPRHIDSNTDERLVLEETFAEWYAAKFIYPYLS